MSLLPLCFQTFLSSTCWHSLSLATTCAVNLHADIHSHFLPLSPRSLMFYLLFDYLWCSFSWSLYPFPLMFSSSVCLHCPRCSFPDHRPFLWCSLISLPLMLFLPSCLLSIYIFRFPAFVSDLPAYSSVFYLMSVPGLCFYSSQCICLRFFMLSYYRIKL